MSEYFPWTIDVKVDSQCANGIRVSDIWKALYDGLQVPISDSEWAILSLQSTQVLDKRDSIMRAAQRRCEDTKKPLRIDWLGRYTKFCGMHKDSKAINRLLLPSATAHQETWVACFSANY